MSECCSFAPEEAKKEEYTVYTDELAKEVGVDPRPNETWVVEQHLFFQVACNFQTVFIGMRVIS